MDKCENVSGGQKTNSRSEIRFMSRPLTSTPLDPLRSYESLIAKLRLVLFTRGFKRNSDPNASVVYRVNCFYLSCDLIL